MAFTAFTPFPYNMTPMANTAPLTYTDGATYLREIAYIKDWLNGILVPGFNANMDALLEDFQTGITNSEARWDLFVENLELELQALNDAALTALIVSEVSATRAALLALIDTHSVAQDELDDQVADLIEEGASAIRVVLDGRYLTLTDSATALALKVDNAELGVANGVATLGGDSKVTPSQLPAPAPLTLTGTYAARPAGTVHPNGTLYYATDTLELYRTNGAVWSVFGAAGNELAFTGIDPSVPMFTTTSTTYVDVPGLSINVTAGERPFKVSFQCAGAADAPSPVKYALYVGGVLRREFDGRASGIDEWETYGGEHTMRGLTPGVSYIAKIMVKAWTGTTCRTSGAPFIQAVGL